MTDKESKIAEEPPDPEPANGGDWFWSEPEVDPKAKASKEPDPKK